MSDDPYAALGVARTASQDEIKKAYRRIAKECHPDLKPDDAAAEARFKAAAAAYDLLKDPDKRARFDRGEIDASGQEKDQRQYYRDYAEAAGNPYRGAQGFDEHVDMSDIFAEFMRQHGARQDGGARRSGGFGGGFQARGQDRHYNLRISFLDSVFGATQQLSLPGGDRIEVRIPAGLRDGQTIRLRGKGDPGFGGGPPGNALVTVSVNEHPVFRREEDDIHVTLPITIDEAVLGGKVATPTIDGRVNVTIPPGTSSGKVLRLRGKGVRRKSGEGRGDQFVEVIIVTPDKIDEELRTFLQAWRKDHAYDPRKEMPS